MLGERRVLCHNKTVRNQDWKATMAEEIIVTHCCTHLSGTVRVRGAKNSALKLIAAALLGQGKSVLHNVPNISDIDIMI